MTRLFLFFLALAALCAAPSAWAKADQGNQAMPQLNKSHLPAVFRHTFDKSALQAYLDDSASTQAPDQDEKTEEASKAYKGPVYRGPRGGKYKDPQHKHAISESELRGGGGQAAKDTKHEKDAKPKKSGDDKAGSGKTSWGSSAQTKISEEERQSILAKEKQKMLEYQDQAVRSRHEEQEIKKKAAGQDSDSKDLQNLSLHARTTIQDHRRTIGEMDKKFEGNPFMQKAFAPFRQALLKEIESLKQSGHKQSKPTAKVSQVSEGDKARVATEEHSRMQKQNAAKEKAAASVQKALTLGKANIERSKGCVREAMLAVGEEKTRLLDEAYNFLSLASRSLSS